MTFGEKTRAEEQKEAAEQTVFPAAHEEFAHKIEPQHAGHEDEEGVGVPNEHQGSRPPRPVVGEKRWRKGVIGRLPVVHVGVGQVIGEWDAGGGLVWLSSFALEEADVFADVGAKGANFELFIPGHAVIGGDDQPDQGHEDEQRNNNDATVLVYFFDQGPLHHAVWFCLIVRPTWRCSKISGNGCGLLGRSVLDDGIW